MASTIPLDLPLIDKDTETHHGLESPPAAISTGRAEMASRHPSGGFKAWMQVLSAFFVFFNTW